MSEEQMPTCSWCGRYMSRHLGAYYYSFAETGVEAVDRILCSVASAGKGYHHTENWCEPSQDDGTSYVDLIQKAAVAAAAALAAATRERDHWKANHDEAIARQRILTDRPDLPLERVRAAEALRTAQRGRDEALAVLGECRGVLAGTPDSADESGNVRALLSRIDALTAKGEER